MQGFNAKKVGLLIGGALLVMIVLRKCSFHTLPKERITTTAVDIVEDYKDGQYELTIKNLVGCPNRIYLSSLDDAVNDLVSRYSPLVLSAMADTTIVIADQGDFSGKVKIKFKWGNPELPIQSSRIERLPFPQGDSYNLLQGNNSNPTHNHDGSRYAFDFTMEIGDTVASAQDGYVVTVIDGYKGWGYGKKWNAFGNQIVVYDTLSHLFTMYGHLKHEGSLVEKGQYVHVGQQIALSGKTGQVPEEHLHFNVLRADNGRSGLMSHRLDSIGDYKVADLQRGQIMTN